MVEFLRDVIIAVAVLATLVAVAVHPNTEAESNRHGGGSDPGIVANAPAVVSVITAPAEVSTAGPK